MQKACNSAYFPFLLNVSRNRAIFISLLNIFLVSSKFSNTAKSYLPDLAMVGNITNACMMQTYICFDIVENKAPLYIIRIRQFLYRSWEYASIFSFYYTEYSYQHISIFIYWIYNHVWYCTIYCLYFIALLQPNHILVWVVNSNNNLNIPVI